jgi:hypothetical protein
MRGNRNAVRVREAQRGATLILVAVGLGVFLGISALAIDLAMLYVTRNEAQRAADAAALAGAKVFVTSGCTSASGGCVTGGAQEAPAKKWAETVGAQNKVGGQAAGIQDADVTFDYSASPFNPRITVVVQRTKARSNAIPTFFVKIFGVTTADIAAKATAEAYNPSGNSTGPTICAACLKPFMLANCDPTHTTPANPSCPGTAGYFIDPSTGAIEHPGAYSAGVVGQEFTIHWGGGQVSPSQYQVVNIGCGQGNQVPCIAGCTTAVWACGSTLNTVEGAKVGEIRPAVNTLIHACGTGPPGSPACQDTITMNRDGSWTITGGTNNPNPALVGKAITNSDSLVTLPIYDGHVVNPGIQPVTIIGYMQLFIEWEDQQVQAGAGAGDIPITVRILNVTGCGRRTGTCGNSSSTVQGGGGSLIPVRLVRNPGT